MITKQICKRCGNTISVLKDGFQFYRTDAYIGNNANSIQYICPYCGAIVEPLKNKYNIFTLTGKSILRSTMYSIFGWVIFGLLVVFSSISLPEGFRNFEYVLQQQFVKEIWLFTLFYGLICTGLASLNIIVLIVLVRNRYNIDFISRDDLVPIGQSVTMIQTLLIFTIISLISSYFIIPKIISEELVLNTAAVRSTLGGITGALASGWSHKMFFRECRK